MLTQAQIHAQHKLAEGWVVNRLRAFAKHTHTMRREQCGKKYAVAEVLAEDIRDEMQRHFFVDLLGLDKDMLSEVLDKIEAGKKVRFKQIT